MPAAGYPLHRLRVAGIDRQNPLRAARALLLAARATGRARRLLRAHRRRRRAGRRRLRGRAGGARGAHAAAAAGADRGRQPPGRHEPAAGAVCARGCSWRFRSPAATGSKYLVTGRPVPSGTEGGDREAARARLGVAPDVACVLVFGGSLGARRLNEAAIDAFGSAAPGAVRPRVRAARLRRTCARGSTSSARRSTTGCSAYIEPFADALAAADLAVARAGGSVFELAAAGPARDPRAVPARDRATTRPRTRASWSRRARRS